MGMDKYVENVSMSSAEKRYKPSKHYVYVLQVTWGDGTTVPIFRRYSEFYDLHIELVDQFPKEAGFGGQRTLPYLPGKKLIREEVEKVATKRKGPLEEYCRALIKMDRPISRHELVIEFFRTRHDDINPPKDATKKPDKSKLFAALGLIVPKFLKKDKDRSDLLAQTSADDLYVSGPVNFDTYYVIADYTAQDRGEISLEMGQEVEVVEKNDNGWWFISYGTEQGWAPASFLEPANTAMELDEPEPLYNGETYITLKAYEAELEDEISFPPDVIVEAIHKHLDGWWIISYDGKVGHAPATYLQQYTNPHFNPTALKNYKPKKVREPTQRRCTIKNRTSKWEAKPTNRKTDMTMYRKMSVKIAEQRKQSKAAANKAPPPPKKKVPSLKEEDEDELYVNNDEAVSLATHAHTKNKPLPIPRGRKSPANNSSEEELPDYTDIDDSQLDDKGVRVRPSSDYEDCTQLTPTDDEEYINVPSPFSGQKSPAQALPTKRDIAKQSNTNNMSDNDRNLFSKAVPPPLARPREQNKKDNVPKAKPKTPTRHSPPNAPKTNKQGIATPLVQASNGQKQIPNWKQKNLNQTPVAVTPASKSYKPQDTPRPKAPVSGLLAQRLAQFGN